MKNANEFIQAVRDEKRGFKFDQPWRLGENSKLTVVPVLRTSKARRNYITFAEAGDIESKDTGSIDYIYVKNNEDKPVFVARGDIFRGKTQERAAIHGHIIMPHKGLRVAVRCIHLSKGINPKENTHYGGRTPYDIDLSDQQRTWNTVTAHNTSYYSNTGTHIKSTEFDETVLNMTSTKMSFEDHFIQTDLTAYNSGLGSAEGTTLKNDLTQALDDIRDSMSEALRKLPSIKNQTGAVFFDDNSMLGLDAYDLPLSWTAIKEEMIAKEGAAIVKDDENLLEIRPERATKIIKKKLEKPFKESIVFDRDYKVISLKNEKMFGEVMIWKDKVIHLSLWKQ